jgi:hypothetical protein
VIAEPTLLEEVITRKHRDTWGSVTSIMHKDPSVKSVKVCKEALNVSQKEVPNSGGLFSVFLGVGLVAVGIATGLGISRYY